MADEDEEIEYFKNYYKLANKMLNYIKPNKGGCLYTVKIKGSGSGFYWSLSDRSFLWIKKRADFYWVSNVKKDDQGRDCLFTPHTFGIGVLLLVPEEEIEWIGLN